MKFKDTLRKAQADHLSITGEKVSDTQLSYLIWDNANKGTVANSIKKFRDKGFSEGVCRKIQILNKTFPNVPIMDWFK